jgi:hypothetical protein
MFPGGELLAFQCSYNGGKLEEKKNKRKSIKDKALLDSKLKVCISKLSGFPFFVCCHCNFHLHIAN